MILPIVIGLGLALAVSIAFGLAGIGRERGFYPVVLVVVASYYDLFAVMGASPRALFWDSVIFVGFVAAAYWGFKKNLWIVAAALAGHGILDLAHAHVLTNPGVPKWWPMFCLSYDVAAALYLGLLLSRSPQLTAAQVSGPR